MDKKLKILILGDSLDVGGAETHIISLANALDRSGHRVTAAAKDGVLRPSLSPRVEFKDIDPSRRGSFKSLRELIKEGDFDIVHAHSRKTAFAVNAVKTSISKPRFGFAVTAHALYKKAPLKDSLSVWGDRCIAVSRDIEKMMRNRFSLPPSAVVFIPNGIDTQLFYPHSSSGSGYRILFASRLDSDCSLGAELLCRIFKRLDKKLRGVTLTIAGGGERYGTIKALADSVNSSLGRRAIFARGGVSDMTKLISECDCAVGVSRFALEAAAMGKNVILFGNEGGLGLLTPKNWDLAASTNFTARGAGVKNEAFLFKELLSFFEKNTENRQKNADFCRNLVISEYSSEATARQTLEVYKSILHRPTVLIGGYYGFGNLGDETVKTVLKTEILSRLPNARVMTLSASPQCSLDINRYSPKSIISAMKKADVYLSGGGSLFQDATSLRSLTYYCSLISLSKLIGCDTAALGNGLGPLRRPISRALVGAALCKCDYISLRDPISLAAAQRLTKGRKAMRLSADPAFSVKLQPCRPEKALAVSLKVDEEKILPLLDMPIVPIAMDKNFDRGIAPEDFRDVGLLMENCAGALGSRLHFLIIAFLCKLPLVPIGNDPKIKAFSESILGLSPISPGNFSDPASLTAEIRQYLDHCRTVYENGAWERMLCCQRARFRRDICDFADFIIKKPR